jgi:single-stranded-DNA-specific exonuclease
MMKNLKEVGDKIKEAIQKNKKIILYGDSDLDGITSVIILKETIENLGGKIFAVYFPDREKEGYGLSEKALEFFKKEAPALLICLDCGISNFLEVKKAKELGFEVIIIDHHQIIDNLPLADLILNPKQPEDPFHFKDLCTAGIVFFLANHLIENMHPALRKNFLELAAIATLADMMPKEKENEEIINEGLLYLPDSWRPGIRIFFEEERGSRENIHSLVSKIISLLNIRDVENGLPAAFRLFTSPNKEKAKEILGTLKEKAKLRKIRIQEIIEEVEEEISKDDPIIFFGKESFELSYLSSVASFLAKKYQKPVFLYKKMEKESHGTVRNPSSLNSVELMKKCKDLLINFGGHPQASGFRLKNENLEKFKKCLFENYIKL